MLVPNIKKIFQIGFDFCFPNLFTDMARHIIADRNRLKRLEVGHPVDQISYVYLNRDQGL